MCHELLFLSLCVFFWEVIKDLYEQPGVCLCVPIKEYEYYEVCGIFAYCWVFVVGMFYIIEIDLDYVDMVYMANIWILCLWLI